MSKKTRVIRDAKAKFDLDEFLVQPLFAHLATQSEHGARDSPVWFPWEDGAVWIIGEKGRNTFIDQLQRDVCCAVSVVDFDPSIGKVRDLGFRGAATILAWSAGRARRRLRKNLGPADAKRDGGSDRFRSNLKPRDDLVFVKVEPQTVVVRDRTYLV